MVVPQAATGYNVGMRLGITLFGVLAVIVLCMPGCEGDDSGKRPPTATKPAESSGAPVASFAEAESPMTGVPESGSAAAATKLASTQDPSVLGPTGGSSNRTLAGKPPLAPKPSEPAETGSQPVRPAAQADSLPPFRPLENARVGEWAVYQGLDSQKLRYEVREVSLSRVKTEVTVTLDGRALGMPAVREDLRTAEPLAWETPADGRRQTSRTTIHAAGRDWEALLYEDRWTDEGIRYVRRTWVGNDAPTFGIIRTELTGDGTLEARMELVEMGVGK